MAKYLSITSDAPGSEELVIADGFNPLYAVVREDLGNPTWQHTYSESAGTRGARASTGTLPNREVAFALRLTGVSKDSTAALLSDLAVVVDELRRYGGIITWASHRQTRRQHFPVIVGAVGLEEWGGNLETIDVARPLLTAVCEPYWWGDPMDVRDRFDTWDQDQYVADSGQVSTFLATSRRLVTGSALAVERRMIHTGRGYPLGDHMASVRTAPGSTLANFKAGVVIARVSATTYTEVYVDDTGSASRLRIDTVINGTRTNRASVGITRLSSQDPVIVQGRLEGNVVYADLYYRQSAEGMQPDATLSYVAQLTAASLGFHAAAGSAGFVFTPQHEAAWLEDFRVEPFTYRDHDRRTIIVNGRIPGDAPALAELVVSVDTDTPHPWGMLAWSPRRLPESLILDHGGESPVNFRWKVDGGSPLASAATSVATSTSASRFGRRAVRAVIPATVGSGVYHVMYRQFRRGQRYRATLWARTETGTASVRLRLGGSTEYQESAAFSLTTTWQQLTIETVPSSDFTRRDLAVVNGAASGATVFIDGVLCWAVDELEGLEPTTPATFHRSGPAPFGYIDGREQNNPLSVGSAGATAGNYHELSASVPTQGATYRSPFWLRPDLLPPDDYTGGDSQEVEVWARLRLSAEFTGGVFASLEVEGSATPDVRLTVPTFTGGWTFHRLGLLRLSSSRDLTAPVEMVLVLQVGNGTNLAPLGIDHLILVNPRSRALTVPTGVHAPSQVDPDYGEYPEFWPGDPDDFNVRRVFSSDLRGAEVSDVTVRASHGLGGAQIELPTGRIELVSLNSSQVPNDPTPPSNSETPQQTTTHLSITPRYHFLRDP